MNIRRKSRTFHGKKVGDVAHCELPMMRVLRILYKLDLADDETVSLPLMHKVEVTYKNIDEAFNQYSEWYEVEIVEELAPRRISMQHVGHH